MKKPKLFVKVFFSTILLLIISEILIISVYTYMLDKKMEKEGMFFFEGHSLFIKRFLIMQLKVKDKYLSDDYYKNIIKELSEIYKAKIWLTYNNQILYKTFKGPVSYRSPNFKSKNKSDDIIMNFKSNTLQSVHIRIYYEKEKYVVLHILYNRAPLYKSLPFIFAQIGIMLLITAFLFPIYRLKIKQLIELENHIKLLARGHLSKRINVNSNDELGELRRGFNLMSDNLEQMVSNLKEVSAHISHELRTPITRILISREILEEKLDAYDKKLFAKHLKLINDDITQMENMINRILQLSKIDLSTEFRNWEEFDLVDIVKNNIGKSEVRIDKKNIVFESYVPGKKILIKAVRSEIDLVVSTVLDNAIKYTEFGDWISIDLNKQDDYAVIKVQNTCRSMTDKQMKYIFDPFYRAGNDGSSGSGLGLAIAQKHIQNNGGKIDAFLDDGIFAVVIKLII